MPDVVQEYVEERFRYTSEYYINFFEVCDRISRKNGRIGMLVPWSFMFKRSYQKFREDLVGERGGFDFLSEYGYGVLDNATVGTVGTVIRSGSQNVTKGTFLRLHDIETKKKESTFLDVLSESNSDVQRHYEVNLAEFSQVPGTPICYSIPEEVRDLHQTKLKLDADRAGIDGQSVGNAVQGLSSGNNDRFLRQHWETTNMSCFLPISRGGQDAWILPKVTETAKWSENGREMTRTESSLLRNKEFYGKEGLTWTYVKRTGRRFGYFPKEGLFDYAGSMLFPEDNISRWAMLAALNSNLYHALFLSITTERHWNIGEVGRIPWRREIEQLDVLIDLAREQYQRMVQLQTSNPISPYYIGSTLLPEDAVNGFFYNHSHPQKAHKILSPDHGGGTAESPLRELARKSKQQELAEKQKLENLAKQIDSEIYSEFGISQSTQERIHQEIFLRTAEDPEDREVPDPESVPEVPENIEHQVKDLIHHFAMEAVREESDGIIPLHNTDSQANMFDRILERFADAYGEYADDRLAEVDEILGTESAAEEAYPNLRAFIENDLFDYHVDRMENTPIIWKLTTERLIADSTGEGFACFVDYHSLDAGLFDRLTNQYLEPRKAELRERRSAANRRRSDDSLSASDQAEAAEQYERCVSGLDQITVFEDTMQDLGSTTEREFDDADRERVEELAPKVAAFRETTRERIDTLAKLREDKSEAWFQDTFSNNFWNAVDEWREEWLDALEELEYACEEYAKPAGEPVEAHLADLFAYFSWRLKGSDHYSSTGILFMTYYFEREGADLLNDDGNPFETLTEDERLLASLATGLDDPSMVDDEFLEAIADDEGVADVADLPPLAEFKALAEEIDDRCQAIDKQIPSDWSDRALSEITTEGYNPNPKHGVEINITPLAEAEIVPKTVGDDVL